MAAASRSSAIVGDVLTVEADIFVDGHDKLAAVVKYRSPGRADWREVPMRFVDNDRWAGSFPLTRNTRYVYTVEAWRDLYRLLAGRGRQEARCRRCRSASS